MRSKFLSTQPVSGYFRNIPTWFLRLLISSLLWPGNIVLNLLYWIFSTALRYRSILLTRIVVFCFLISECNVPQEILQATRNTANRAINATARVEVHDVRRHVPYFRLVRAPNCNKLVCRGLLWLAEERLCQRGLSECRTRNDVTHALIEVLCQHLDVLFAGD